MRGRRLHAYVARQYLASLGLCLAGLVGLLVGTSLVEHAGSLAQQPTPSWAVALMGMAAAVEMAYQHFPAAAFLATLLTGVVLARRGELLAIEASGMGARHLMGPLGGVVLLAALVAFLLGELAVPLARQQSQRSLGALGKHHSTPGQRNAWFRDGNKVLYLPEVDVGRQQFLRPSLYVLEDGRLVESLEAAVLQPAAAAAAGAWELHQVRRQFVAHAAVETYDVLPLQLRVRPQDLLDRTGDPRLLSLPALRRSAARRERAGYDATGQRLEAQTRLAQPLSAALLTAVALPQALRPRQRASTARALGSGVALLCAYLALQQACRLLAAGHSLSPAAGAWGAPLLAVAVALLLAGGRRLSPGRRGA